MEYSPASGAIRAAAGLARHPGPLSPSPEEFLYRRFEDYLAQFAEFEDYLRRQGEPGPGPDGEEPDPVEAMLAELLTAAQLQERANPVPLINGLLDMNSEAWIIGASGSYKSFVAFDMASHITAGLDWRGMSVTQGQAWIIVAEGVSGMKLRAKAWEEAHRRECGVKFLPRPVQAEGGDWDTLVKCCEKLKPVLVVIDTQARSTVGLDENSGRDMGFYIAQVGRIKQATGGCVLTVHHTGLSGDRLRGHTSINGAQDTELKMTKLAGLRAEMKVTKQKDLPGEGDTYDLSFVPHDFGSDPVTGRKLTSLSISPRTPETAALRSEPWIEELPRNQARIVAVFTDHLFGAEGATKSEIKRLVVEHGAIRDSSYYTAWNALVGHGKLVPVGKSTTKFALASTTGGDDEVRSPPP